MKRWSRISVVVSLAMALGVGASWGREEPVFTPLVERDEVRFITLDVVIQQKERRRWQPAVGLTRDEITVWVGGEPMTLEQFDRHCGPGEDPQLPGAEHRDEPAATPTPPADSPEWADEAPEDLPTLGPEPVRYILYFDLIHLKLGGFHSSFRAAERWIEKTVRPGDEVMIVTGADALRIVRPLRPADDHLLDELALARADYIRTDMWAEREGNWLHGRVREILDQPGSSPPLIPGEPPIKAIAVAYASMDYNRTRRSLINLTHMMTLFEDIEGTKNLILFQQTLRIFPGSAYPTAGPLSEVTPFLDRLARAANERNVRIYPVDAAGLRIRGGIDDAMTHLASKTGGRWLEGSNDLSLVFDRVAEDASCFFRVGFAIRPQFSGHTETIRVTIERDGRFRTRHRRTLHDPTREQREEDSLRAAFLQPSTATELPVSLSTASLLREGDRERVRLQIRLPLTSLLALPAGAPGEEHRQILVQLGATLMQLRPAAERGAGGTAGSAWADVALGGLSWSFSRQGSLRLPFQDGASDGRDLILAEEILVMPGDYRVVAVAQDRLAATLGAVVSDFTVLDESSALSEILLLEETGDDMVLQRPTDEEEPLAKPADRKRGKRPRTVLTARPLLSADLATPPRQFVRPGRASRVSYGVCADTATDDFEGWRLARTLVCEGLDEPLEFPERPLPSLEPNSRCVLLTDPLPARMAPGSCRFALRLSREGVDDETRSLGFRFASSESARR